MLFLLTGARPSESALLTLDTNLSTNEQYTDNVIISSSGRESDWITSVNPSLHLGYHPVGFSGDLAYQIQPTWYLRHPELDRINQSGDVHLTKENPLWTAKGGGGVISTTMSQEVAQANGGILIPQTRFIQQQAQAEFQYRQTRLASTVVNYSYFSTRYNSSSLVDSLSHNAGFSETYGATANDQLTFSGGWSVYHFGLGQSSTAETGMLRWNHQAGALLLLRFGTGVGVVSGSSIEWLVNAKVEKKTEAGSLTAGYQRDIGAGGGLSAASVVNQRLDLSATQGIAPGLSGSLSVMVGESSGIQGQSFETRTWTVSAGMAYKLVRWLDGTAAVSHSDQRSRGTFLGKVRTDQIIVGLSTHLLPWVLVQ